MEDSPGLHFHPIACVSDWPVVVQPIARLVTERMPPWVACGPHPPISPIAAYLIPELEKSATGTSPLACAHVSENSQLKDCFDVAMSSCADLRALTSMNPMEPVLTKTITFGLVAALFRTCSGSLIPRKRASFVDGGMAEFLLVQTMTHDDFAASEHKLEPFLQSELDEASDHDDDAEGNVIVEAQSHVDVSGDDECAESENYLSVDPSNETPQFAPVFRRRGSSRCAIPDIPHMMTETERSELSSLSSLASLEIPQCAHVLNSSASCVDLPIVCITEAEAMPFVMSKLLHQRQVWGVTEPVVGFIITSDGLNVQLALGWIDESGMEPTAHWATPCDSSSQDNMGIYQLTDPFQCLSLAWLILGLYERTSLRAFLQTLRHQARSTLLPAWSWSPEITRVVASKEPFIEKWRLDVAKSARIGIGSLSSLAEDARVTNGLQSPTGNASGDSTQSEATSQAHIVSTGDAPQSQSHSLGCGITQEQGNSAIDFLTDRNIFVVPYIAVTRPYNIVSVTNIFLCVADMMSIYNYDTQSRWVKAWEQQTALPNLGPRLMKHWEELLANTKLREAEVFLENKVAYSLTSYLPGIIECCDLARTRNNRGERRQSWEQLLTIMALMVNSTTSDLFGILCDRSINLPVNPYRTRFILEDRIVFEDLKEYLARIFLLRNIYSNAAHASLTGWPIATRLSTSAQCESIGGDFDRCLAQIEAFRFKDRTVSTATFEEIIRKRCFMEPLLGTCDIILGVQCGEINRQIHEAAFNALYALRAPSTSVQDAFDNSVSLMENFHLIFPSPVVSKPQDKSGRSFKHEIHFNRIERTHKSGARNDAELNLFQSLIAAHVSSSPGLGVGLMLPSLFVVFEGSENDTDIKATNQARICAAAALAFLEVFGIVNEPIYLLVVSGGLGTLSMAMRNEREFKPNGLEKKQSLVMDRLVRAYDIANTRDAYEFAVFVQALAERGRKLKSRFFEHILPLFLQRVKEDPSILQWSTRSWISEDEERRHS